MLRSYLVLIKYAAVYRVYKGVQGVQGVLHHIRPSIMSKLRFSGLIRKE